MSGEFFNKIATKNNRRILRKNSTPHEKILWAQLRNNQLGKKFKRQYGIGPYIADFYCSECRLVIEIDGGQHFSEKNASHDKLRTAFLEQQNCTVIRFTNANINTNLEGVLLLINTKLDQGGLN